MRTSEECIDAIKGFEACSLRAYKCPAGVLTIGYGHTQGVKEGQVITQAQADSLLRGDILPVETYLNSVPVDFTQGQFDALVDFCFNLGITKFKGSTLYNKVITKSPDSDIIVQFNKWVYGGGKKLNGLVKRRAWEASQWIKR